MERGAETIAGTAKSWSYLYDNLDRLTEANDGVIVAESYQYHDQGHRIKKSALMIRRPMMLWLFETGACSLACCGVPLVLTFATGFVLLIARCIAERTTEMIVALKEDVT